MQSTDHLLTGFDIGPWLQRIVTQHPDVILMVEVMKPEYTNEMKLDALNRWLYEG